MYISMIIRLCVKQMIHETTLETKRMYWTSITKISKRSHIIKKNSIILLVLYPLILLQERLQQGFDGIEELHFDISSISHRVNPLLRP